MKFSKTQHESYIRKLSSSSSQDSLASHLTSHLKLNALYWASTSLDILNVAPIQPTDTLTFLMACYDPQTGAFGGNVGMDVGLLYTLSAIQVLTAMNKCVPDKEKTAKSSLQNPNGSFSGDCWGEVDIRFTYCAVSALSLLKLPNYIDSKSAIQYIMSCCNESDGGWATAPGGESHGALVWCAVASLSILGAMDWVEDCDAVGWWLSERQVAASGGLNGRPEKKEDVCYSWWVLASLKILERDSWIDGNKLREFILSCQDLEDGGIADRPGNVVDIFHTLFGLAGLSVLGEEGLEEVDPRYCMTARVIRKLGL